MGHGKYRNGLKTVILMGALSVGRGATAAAIGIPSTVADAPTNVLGAVSGDRRVTLSWTAFSWR